MSAGGPLSGITVIDFSELLPGPFFTQNLAEMGARVIKIERPPGGDNARRMGAGSFASINRGKQSLLVDLKDESQRSQVRELISTADVLVESYRPGVMARLGFDHASLRAEFPRLVYVSLSGYGQDGPWANLPGHDINYLAAAGVLAVSGAPEGPPEQSFGLPVADLCGSMYALSSTLAALFQREHTGQGQYLDVALAECVLHWMNPRLGAFQGGAAARLDQQRAAAQIKPAYGTFRCRDHQHLSVAALEDHFWQRLCAVLDMGEFAADGYRELDARKKRAQDINARMAEQIGQQDLAALNEALIRSDIPASPVVAPSDLAATPQFAQRGLMTCDAPLSLVRYPVRMEGVVPEALTEATVLDNARLLP